jgi:putative DNA methylase
MPSGSEPRKKLIEVALPLDAINKASAREKSIRHGHPSTLHLWWARRPLATARAVIFGQMVDDPSTYVDTLLDDPPKRRGAEQELRNRREQWETRRAACENARSEAAADPGPEPTLEGCAADIERQRLFEIIADLVQWENTTNEDVLEKARAEIRLSWRRACADNADHPRAKELFDPDRLPAFHDPFAGGGALPLEAQRLGLESYASDLNPVAVLINKAMIEIPPKFAGKPPVNPRSRAEKSLHPRQWRGAQGLADDVRYYGQWMRDEAEKRIGHLYPNIEITAEMAKERSDLKPLIGQKLTVVAWLWARTVKSPNPAFADVDVPLASTFTLSNKAGKEAYVEPTIENGRYRFTVKVGKPKDPEATKGGTKLSRGANFRCVMSGIPISGDHIKAEGKAGRMGARLMAIVAEGSRGRLYLSPIEQMETVARSAKPTGEPSGTMVDDARAFTPGLYGLTDWSHLFTARQLIAMSTFSELVHQVRERVIQDAVLARLPDDSRKFDHGGIGATAYGDAVSVYLALGVSKLADSSNALVSWKASMDQPIHLFTRQAVPMVWDFAEPNVFSNAMGDLTVTLRTITRVLDQTLGVLQGYGIQEDACVQKLSEDKIVSTDPPYYDNVPYADLSDFFYVWLRGSLKSVFPDLFATVAVPKVEELVATTYRHGGRAGAEAFFLTGMAQAMNRITELVHPALPVSIYYAFKQAESHITEGTARTGWETFLDAVMRAGFCITGTWPVRTELGNRIRGIDSNALASSIVLVCRPRTPNAPIATRRDFVTALKTELPQALVHLQRGNIAPVDLAQAAIGPGMAVYCRFAEVLDAEGKQLSVHEALGLINETLDEVLREQEGDFDPDSRWAVTWFEQSGFGEGDYGIAELLSKSKVTDVAKMAQAGILSSRAGKVRLSKPEELPADWDPDTDPRLTAWEIVHQLIRSLESGGERAAAVRVAKLGAKAEVARELAYRLYTVSERKKRATEALSYNGLVQSWPEITRLAREAATARPTQPQLI